MIYFHYYFTRIGQHYTENKRLHCFLKMFVRIINKSDNYNGKNFIKIHGNRKEYYQYSYVQDEVKIWEQKNACIQSYIHTRGRDLFFILMFCIGNQVHSKWHHLFNQWTATIRAQTGCRHQLQTRIRRELETVAIKYKLFPMNCTTVFCGCLLETSVYTPHIRASTGDYVLILIGTVSLTRNP